MAPKNDRMNRSTIVFALICLAPLIRAHPAIVKRPNVAQGRPTHDRALAANTDPTHVDGMKAENVIPTYEKHGKEWAKTRNRSLMEKTWLDRMLTAAPRATGPVRILDLGCGTGQPIGTYLSERGAQMTGVDAAGPMVTAYATNVPQSKVIEADMRALKLDRTFDAIIAWNSFFHLSVEDQRAMFPVFAAHAAPRATLMFTSGHMAGEAIGTVAGAPIYHASLAPDEYRALLAENRFKVLRFTPEDPDCGQHTVWLVQYKG